MSLAQPQNANANGGGGGPPPPRTPANDQNPLKWAYRLLRGRYAIAITLACVFGLGGAAAGYLALQPVYQSTATIRIAPMLPKVLYESEANSMLPMFGSYVDTQIALLKSRRVGEMAFASETWRETAGDAMPTAEVFAGNLSVHHPNGGQLVYVTYEANEAENARAGAAAVVESYLQVYSETDQVKEAERLALLEERRRSLTAEIDGLNREILAIANEFGTDALKDMHAYKVEQLQTLETELRSARIELASIEGDGDESEAKSAADMTVEEIGAVDIRMQTLLDERRDLQTQLDELALVYKQPERFKDYQSIEMRLKRNQTEIDKRAAQFRENFPLNVSTPVADENGMPTPVDPARVALRYERLKKLYDEQREETLELGRKSLQIENLRTQMARAQESLDRTKDRIEQLSVESSVGGRISVLSEPEVPNSPANAHRAKQLAAVGGVGGAGFAVALVMLFGLINPRVRYIADAEEVRPRLLGALPELPKKLNDPTEAMVAAQCVHQIRTMLQTRANGQNGFAITVTSAGSGTGKSSMALSLGISFAAAGSRTLLIDADVIGMGLTSLVSAGSSNGAPKAEEESDSAPVEDQTAADATAHETAESVNNTLLAMYDEENKPRKSPKDCHWGLAGALEGEDLADCIVDIDVPNLTFLPACGNMRTPANLMSRRLMRSFLDYLRHEYEVIVIDTGPVPSPTDSSIMAAVADSVLMMVSRGEHNTAVRQALQHLDLIQAPIVGLVFNRAQARDLEASGHSSTNSSKLSVYSEAVRAEHADGFAKMHEYERFGPLPQAVWAMSVHHDDYPNAVIVN